MRSRTWRRGSASTRSRRRGSRGATWNHETIGIAFHRVKPDCRQAFAHRHDEAEEIYVVLSGSGRIKLGDDVREVGEMDAIRVAPEVMRAFEAGPDGLELLVFGPRHADDRGAVSEDFWAGAP